MLTPDFTAHRSRLLEQLAEDEAVLLFGAPLAVRSNDTDYPYRPTSDVWYLTGWPDPDVAVFLRPGETPFTLFCQPKDPEREMWEGLRPGPEGAKTHYGADAAFPIDQLPEELARLLQGVRALHYPIGHHAEHDALVLGAIQKAGRAARKNGLDVPETFHAPRKLLHELRLHKLPDEVGALREAARITCAGHRAAMALAAPGVNEAEVEAVLDFVYRTEGGQGPGYNHIVAGGPNACILHYVRNRDPLQDGQLLLIDSGCERELYTADVTRTFPVNGTFSPIQREVYAHVLQAQKAAIDAAQPGRPYRDMHEAAVRVLTEAMVDLGLLKGDVDDLIEQSAFRRYYPHGTGHWLGLDVHDVGTYVREGGSRPLQPGMALTVEPGLYVPPDDDQAPEHLRGIGIRIEDDIVIGPDGPEVLTSGVPKEIEEVEAACRAPLELPYTS